MLYPTNKTYLEISGYRIEVEYLYINLINFPKSFRYFHCFVDMAFFKTAISLNSW